MATLASSSSLLFSYTPSRLPQPSLSRLPSLSFSSSFPPSSFLSSSVSISHSFLTFPTSSKRHSLSTFTVQASTAEKKKVLIVNTNSGGHAIIGFYFAKELLGSGHEVTIMTVGEEASDKMKKPPFNRFSVKLFMILIENHNFQSCFCLYSIMGYFGILELIFGYLMNSQEIVSAGGKTVWGDPADVGNAVGGAAFDVALDNNGKDLDTVRFVD